MTSSLLMPPLDAPLHPPSLGEARARETHTLAETPATPCHPRAQPSRCDPSPGANADQTASPPAPLAPRQASPHSPAAACRSAQIRAGNFHTPPRGELPAHVLIRRPP